MSETIADVPEFSRELVRSGVMSQADFAGAEPFLLTSISEWIGERQDAWAVAHGLEPDAPAVNWNNRREHPPGMFVDSAGKQLENVPPIRPPFPKVWAEWSHVHTPVETSYIGALAVTKGDEMLVRVVGGERNSNSTPQWSCKRVLNVAIRFDASGGFDVKPLAVSPAAARHGLANVSTFSPLIWAFALLNTKNISAPVHPLSRAARRRIEKGHEEPSPVRSFRVLTVSTSGGIQSIDDASGERLTKLHLVRGHFARYTEEKPLFGRLTGTFWRSPHLRGDVERGAVVKAYRVEGPLP